MVSILWECGICKERKIKRSEKPDRWWENGTWKHDVSILICNDCLKLRYDDVMKKFNEIKPKEKIDYYLDDLLRNGDDITFIAWISAYIEWIYEDKICAQYGCYNIKTNLNGWLRKTIDQYLFRKCINKKDDLNDKALEKLETKVSMTKRTTINLDKEELQRFIDSCRNDYHWFGIHTKDPVDFNQTKNGRLRQEDE